MTSCMTNIINTYIHNITNITIYVMWHHRDVTVWCPEVEWDLFTALWLQWSACAVNACPCNSGSCESSSCREDLCQPELSAILQQLHSHLLPAQLRVRSGPERPGDDDTLWTWTRQQTGKNRVQTEKQNQNQVCRVRVSSHREESPELPNRVCPSYRAQKDILINNV